MQFVQIVRLLTHWEQRRVLLTSLIFLVIMSPLLVFELLFFAIFGQTTYDELIVKATPGRPPYRPLWTDNLFKVTFGIYMLVSVVVLINLLIAMMSDTYQRIQVTGFILFLQSKRIRWALSSCCFCGLWSNVHRSTENLQLQFEDTN